MGGVVVLQILCVAVMTNLVASLVDHRYSFELKSMGIQLHSFFTCGADSLCVPVVGCQCL